jgi:hypothetical protein
MIEVELPLKARLAGHVLVTLELTHLRVAYAIEFFIFFLETVGLLEDPTNMGCGTV